MTAMRPASRCSAVARSALSPQLDGGRRSRGRRGRLHDRLRAVGGHAPGRYGARHLHHPRRPAEDLPRGSRWRVRRLGGVVPGAACGRSGCLTPPPTGLLGEPHEPHHPRPHPARPRRCRLARRRPDGSHGTQRRRGRGGRRRRRPRRGRLHGLGQLDPVFRGAALAHLAGSAGTLATERSRAAALALGLSTSAACAVAGTAVLGAKKGTDRAVHALEWVIPALLAAAAVTNARR